MMPLPQAPNERAGPGQHALAYASLGWRVLPIKPGEKRPPMSAWQKEASTDAELIKNWFRNLYRGHGCGIATGPESDVWVLDIDVGEGKVGLESLAELEARHGVIPDTVEAITGSGGRHLYFVWPEGRKVVTRRDTGTTDSPLPAGIDVRGEGGQVLAPPTKHPNGTTYLWRPGHAPWELDAIEAPDWLLQIVCERPAPSPEPKGQSADSFLDGFRDVDSIAEWHNGRWSWSELLLADGWQPLQPHGDQQYWVRPGKEKRDGHSATLHLPDGPFVIFSTDGSLSRYAQPWARNATGDGWAFSKFGYTAASKHGGDRSEAARRLRELRTQTERSVLGGEQPGTPDAPDMLPQPLDWHAVFARTMEDEDWLVEDFWPARRAISVVAQYKSGKSLLLFYIAACLAQGRDPWTGRAVPPITVGYWDMEMTEDDVHERAIDFGLQPENLDRFKYYLLPSVPPLDTADGGRAVLATLRRDGVQATVFDTFGRVLEGEENDAHTINSYYRNTARHLKAEGISSARLDHVGHAEKNRARGSSSKGADVDVAWVLKRAEGNAVTLDHHLITRVRWVPKVLDLILIEGPPDRYSRTSGNWPAGTKEAAEQLDRLGIPLDLGRDKVRQMLRDHGEEGARNDVLSAAIKFRKELAGSDFVPGTGAGTGLPKGLGTGAGTGAPIVPLTSRGQVGDRSGQEEGPSGDMSPSLGGDRSSGLSPEDEDLPF